MTDQTTIPTTATEARAVLDARLADKSWGDRVYAGDIAGNKELRELTTKVAAGGDDVVVAAMSGKLPDIPTSDERIMAGVADWMRQKGFHEKAIKETIEGKEASAEDLQRARVLKT